MNNQNKRNDHQLVNDGIAEPKKQKAEIQSRMFQFLKSKRGGRRK